MTFRGLFIIDPEGKLRQITKEIQADEGLYRQAEGDHGIGEDDSYLCRWKAG